MSESVQYFASIGVLLVAAAGVPWFVMRALVPSLESSAATAENYRGRPVVVALGLVWLVWALALLALSYADTQYAELFSPDGMPFFTEFFLDTLPFLLVVGTMAFGMADDFLGGHAEKGFRGHLAALAHGRFTTGALKLFGVAVLAALTTAPEFLSDAPVWSIIGVWALETAAIGLTANLVNLVDLRPGRALKVYSALIVAGCVLYGATTSWAAAPLVAIICLAPVAAVWRFDLGERAMLGDAGANAAGVLAGWVIVQALANVWWALGMYVAVVFALNVVSERVSFSAVIDRVPVLRWLDGLGRVRENSPPI